MKSYLESQIKARQARLRELEGERTAVLAELRAYEDMLGHFFSGGDKKKPAHVALEPRPDAAHQGFEMTPTWITIMGDLAAYKSFTAADIVRIGEEHGFGTTTTQARAQLAFYRKKKYITRINRGQYKVTPLGEETFKKKAPADDSASAPFNDLLG